MDGETNKEMPKEKSLSKNSIFYLIYNVLNVLFPLITGIYVAHVLLPDNIGQVETARNFAQYFVILAFLGIPTYGLREVAKARNDKYALSKVYSELVILNAISTAIFFVIYFSLVIFIPYYQDNLVLYLVAGISIALNFLNNSWLYEGLEEFKFISLRNLFFKIVTFVLLIVLVRDQGDYIWYAVLTVIGTAGNYIFNVLKAHKFVRFSFKGIELKKHLKPIFFLVAVNLAIEIYSLVDVTMLGFMCGDDTVAFYSYGMKIYKIFLQVINTFTMVLVPRLAVYYESKRMDEFNNVLSKTLKIILLLAIPMIVGIMFVGDYTICAIYGDAYIRSSYVLKILSLILVISPVGYLLGSRMLLVTGNEKKMIIPVGLGAITNVITNFILIPPLAEVGATIASVIGEVVVMIAYLILGHRYFKLNNMWSTIIKEGVAVLIMACYLFGISFIPISRLYVTIIQVVGAVAIYFLLLILMKEPMINSVFAKSLQKFRGEQMTAIKKIISKLKVLFFNIIVYFKGVLIGRDKKVILFGAWGGERFADNSRFLYQYLFNSKEKYGIKKVVWVTRDNRINKELNDLGYESYLIGTKESDYWHLKAGVHVLCNFVNNAATFLPDIDVKLSAGAKKLQLWHGVGIKACGYLRNDQSVKQRRFAKLCRTLFGCLFTDGFWGRCFYLATSEENKRVISADFNVKKKRIIIASYPRLCDEVHLLPNEIGVLDYINSLKKVNKIVLYLPTFKNDISNFKAPDELLGFENFLTDNNIIWVEKLHSADNKLTFSVTRKNTVLLPTEFDVNVLYKYIDLLITDYSSATSDAIYHNKLSVEYCPDYSKYQRYDRGFVNDFEKYHIFDPIINADELFDFIKNVLNTDPNRVKKLKEVKSFLFGSKAYNMDDIFIKIKKDMRI